MYVGHGGQLYAVIAHTHTHIYIYTQKQETAVTEVGSLLRTKANLAFSEMNGISDHSMQLKACV